MKKATYRYKLSVICIVSDSDLYEKWTAKGLRNQTDIGFEVIPVFNEHNKNFKNAREALNYGAELAKGEYLLFIHQDVLFEEKDVLCKLVKYAENIGDFGVIGVAGTPRGSKWELLSNITHGDCKHPAGRRIKNAVSVMTVDECMFLIMHKHFEISPFSNRRGWHLYAVEYCLKAMDEGKSNYVVPLELWHASDGASLDASYCDEIAYILERYKEQYQFINTTVKQWRTNIWGRRVYVPYYKLKQTVKRKLRDLQRTRR